MSVLREGALTLQCSNMSDSDFSKRKFIMHPAHSAVGVSTNMSSPNGASLADDLARTGSPTWKKKSAALSVCMLSGSPGDKSQHSLESLAGFLDKNYSVRCAKSWNGTPDAVNPDAVNPGAVNLDDLEWCDCLLLFAQRMTLDSDQLQRLRRYVARGGAIVGLRSAGRALQQWPELDGKIFGGSDRGQCNNRSTEVNLVDGCGEHAVLTDVAPFISHCQLCKQDALAEDAEVLLTGTSYGRMEPVAWAREHNGGRIFYTSLGHPDDFFHPSFLQLLVNAISWTSRQTL